VLILSKGRRQSRPRQHGCSRRASLAESAAGNSANFGMVPLNRTKWHALTTYLS